VGEVGGTREKWGHPKKIWRALGAALSPHLQVANSFRRYCRQQQSIRITDLQLTSEKTAGARQ